MKFYLKTVYYLSGPVNFNGENANITGDTVPELHEQRYIDTGVRLFDEENYMKDFEIGFEIEEYKTENQDKSNTQQTFVNSKYENESAGYPGFVFRRAGTGLEFTCRVGDDKKTQRLQDALRLQRKRAVRCGRARGTDGADSGLCGSQQRQSIGTRYQSGIRT